jgi:glycosyltransferase involved in cell wall biosynthesis
MIQAKLSVIIPTRNRCEQLSRAVNSIFAQTWKNIEIIIIDDASTDNTILYLSDLVENNNNVKFISNKIAVGASNSRNLGINIATGYYIGFLDDDDIWHPQKAYKQISLLKASNKYSASTCNFKIIYQNFPFYRIKKIPQSNNLQDILKTNYLGGASMCLTYKHLLLQANGFDESLLSCQDWDMWFKLQNLGEIGIINEVLVDYYFHKSEQITSKISNAYAGRCGYFFKYRHEMTNATIKYNIATILFIRIMSRKDNLFKKIKRMKLMIDFLSLRTLFIYTRILLIDHLKKYLKKSS